MKSTRLLNQTRGTVVCDSCGIADNLFTRVRGLLGRTSLADHEGLLITPCPSIHMFGMKFAIDAIFVTRGNVVTDLVEGIAPGQVYTARKHHGKPYATIELPVGAISRSQTQLGDLILCEDRATRL